MQVEAWALQQDHYEVMHTLQQVGVAAGAIPTGLELLAEPHLKERGLFQVVDRAVVGPHHYPRSAPMILSESPGEKQKPAPLLGEHSWQSKEVKYTTTETILIIGQILKEVIS